MPPARAVRYKSRPRDLRDCVPSCRGIAGNGSRTVLGHGRTPPRQPARACRTAPPVQPPDGPMESLGLPFSNAPPCCRDAATTISSWLAYYNDGANQSSVRKRPHPHGRLMENRRDQCFRWSLLPPVRFPSVRPRPVCSVNGHPGTNRSGPSATAETGRSNRPWSSLRKVARAIQPAPNRTCGAHAEELQATAGHSRGSRSARGCFQPPRSNPSVPVRPAGYPKEFASSGGDRLAHWRLRHRSATIIASFSAGFAAGLPWARCATACWLRTQMFAINGRSARSGKAIAVITLHNLVRCNRALRCSLLRR